MIERDEFLGKTSYINENEIIESVGDKLYQQRYLAISKAIRERILGDDDPDVMKVKKLLEKANVNVNELELADLGKLIGRFISDKFKCEESRWDKYLAGDQSAISSQEKRGAALFYGRARCSICHSGEFQSDFSFHSIGVP